MILRKIVHTCSNVHVAEAAVGSIEGDFAFHFAVEAARRSMTSGEFAAQYVKQFAVMASDEELECLARTARNSDQPILAGLRYILSRIDALRYDEPEDTDEEAPIPQRA